MVKSSRRSVPLGITCGDPAGIGPEIILKALARLPKLDCRVIGPLGRGDDSIESPGAFTSGSAARAPGNTARLALELGAHLLRTGQVSALVTAPVNKTALKLAGFGWPGQTEFLAERLGAERHAMLAWTPRYKAVFVTIHLPLAEVGRHVTAAAVAEKAALLDGFLRRERPGAKRPRICCLALNPHGREFSLGEEDRIAAGIDRARRSGVEISGPVPADAALARADEWDGYVAMYHAQAMIPAKLLARGEGVNVTLGLPGVRTSPLHGTAFDIAGRGRADESSMLAAIRLARRLTR